MWILWILNHCFESIGSKGKKAINFHESTQHSLIMSNCTHLDYLDSSAMKYIFRLRLVVRFFVVMQ